MYTLINSWGGGAAHAVNREGYSPPSVATATWDRYTSWDCPHPLVLRQVLKINKVECLSGYGILITFIAYYKMGLDPWKVIMLWDVHHQLNAWSVSHGCVCVSCVCVCHVCVCVLRCCSLELTPNDMGAIFSPVVYLMILHCCMSSLIRSEQTTFDHCSTAVNCDHPQMGGERYHFPTLHSLIHGCTVLYVKHAEKFHRVVYLSRGSDPPMKWMQLS